MNPPPAPNSDPELSKLLRAAHPAPSLPPRFQEGVWRRLERSERPIPTVAWVDRLIATLFRPAYASLGLAAVLLAGVWTGSRGDAIQGRRTEQARYLAAVSPLHQAP